MDSYAIVNQLLRGNLGLKLSVFKEVLAMTEQGDVFTEILDLINQLPKMLEPLFAENAALKAENEHFRGLLYAAQQQIRVLLDQNKNEGDL